MNQQLHDIEKLDTTELLKLLAEIGEALRSRGIIRSANNPAGDLAEYLFCKALDWELASYSEKGHDAVCKGGKRYEIKARRVHKRNNSCQVSAIRDFAGNHFDMLAGVIFDDDYRVIRAALIPRDVIEQKSTYNKHTNSHRFILRDSIWDIRGVTDVTEKLKAAMISENESSSPPKIAPVQA